MGLSEAKPCDTPMVPNVRLNVEDEEMFGDPERYRRIVGKLNYLTVTRPDIAFSVSVVSQFMSSPRTSHWDAVLHILKYLKGALGHGILYSDHGHNKVAVMNRQEKVFNLIFEISSLRNLLLMSKDSYGKDVLHLAGKLAREYKLNLIPGEAMQMKHELHWFKMKSAATSSSGAAALIATLAFAAGMTIPGNYNDEGRPNFNKQTTFLMFGVSDTISMCSSLAAIIMFSSIFTSRYAEEDFFKRFPGS
ncbi:uncharacterized protein LOC116133918 [Pistacia vera]|uniref:uncharacterized protein LOC116133918 n=1 Tax=Pistacia vera TaxID=55513 RepID=UPI0012633EC5|nr:uncharacterized protein LOC116133918 [Pistacia vera]